MPASLTVKYSFKGRREGGTTQAVSASQAFMFSQQRAPPDRKRQTVACLTPDNSVLQDTKPQSLS